MNSPAPQTDLARAIEQGASSSLFGRWRRWAWLAGVLALAAAAFWWWRSGQQEAAPLYRTEAVSRGDLTVTVTATGSLQPTNQVDVGSELSGTTAEVLVEENAKVRKGQVLARLDPSKLQDQVLKSRAALASARASVAQAQATVQQARASMARLKQVAELSGGKVPSKAELDTADAELKRALATEEAARAAVAQAEATLRSDETNLTKASIRSPIDGIVLAREIEPGQTVAASLQAPTLFTLAENLAQMELLVNVDEADVGQVRDGMAAEFTVDAHPGRRYPATIKRVNFGSTTTENVVTYPAVLAVANDDLSLRPGMTATAEIVVQQRKAVLLVPNAALRFTPATKKSAQPSGGLLSAMMPRPPRPSNARSPEDRRRSSKQVWVLEAGEPQAVAVRLGASDGRMTEVLGGELREGMAVIIDTQSRAK